MKKQSKESFPILITILMIALLIMELKLNLISDLMKKDEDPPATSAPAQGNTNESGILLIFP